MKKVGPFLKAFFKKYISKTEIMNLTHHGWGKFLVSTAENA